MALAFGYDGGAPGAGADLALSVDAVIVAAGRLEETTAYYFSFDETFNVGVDRGTATSPEYVPLRNRCTGEVLQVRVDLGDDVEPLTEAQEQQRLLAHE